MKILLTFFVLLFSSSVFADDISDFQIGGIGIGDNLLDHFSASEIKKNYKSNYYNFKKDKSFIAIEFNDTNKFFEYDTIQIHIPNFDKKYVQKKINDYEVVHIVGMKIMEFNECKKEAYEIDTILSNAFKSAEKEYEENGYLDADPSGNSSAGRWEARIRCCLS